MKKLKIKTGVFTDKTIQEKPIPYFEASNINGDPEKLRQSAKAALEWLHRNDQ